MASFAVCYRLVSRLHSLSHCVSAPASVPRHTQFVILGQMYINANPRKVESVGDSFFFFFFNGISNTINNNVKQMTVLSGS